MKAGNNHDEAGDSLKFLCILEELAIAYICYL